MITLRQNTSPVGWFGILYGKPGVGKTSLFANSKGCLFVGNEENPESQFPRIASMEQAHDWADFYAQLRAVLNDKMEGYHTLVIDNFSDLEGMLCKSLFGEKNIATWKGGYGAGYNELEKCVRYMTTNIFIPLQKINKNVVMITHATEREVPDEESQEQYHQNVPFLEKKTLRPLQAHANWIFYLHRPWSKDKKELSKRELITDLTPGTLAKKKANIKLPYRAVINDINTAWSNIMLKSGLGESLLKGKITSQTQSASDVPKATPKPAAETVPPPEPPPAAPPAEAKAQEPPKDDIQVIKFPAPPEPPPQQPPPAAPLKKEAAEAQPAAISKELQAAYDQVKLQMPSLVDLNDLLKRHKGNADKLLKHLKKYLETV